MEAETTIRSLKNVKKIKINKCWEITRNKFVYILFNETEFDYDSVPVHAVETRISVMTAVAFW
jgi:hypothetical protein